MGDGEHLHGLGKTRQATADGIGHGATDAGVDFVKDQDRRGAAISKDDLQGQ